MGLFRPMKNPVRGSGEVVAQMAPLCGGRGELRLIVTAEGVPPTSVEISVSALNTKAIGLASLPVARIIAVVDQANSASLRVAERIGMTKVDVIEAHGRPHVRFAASASSVGAIS